MSKASALAIPVDLCNPAEVFACCGLLETAHRLCAGAEGWFSTRGDGDTYHLVTGEPSATVRGILHRLLDVPEFMAILDAGAKGKGKLGTIKNAEEKAAPPETGGADSSGKIDPIQLTGNVALRLDWWIDQSGRRKAGGRDPATPFKLWAGQQSSLSIVQALVPELKKILDRESADPLRHRVPLSGRFGFDPTAAWVALDVGWSPNEQGVEVGTAPVVELLVAIGLQRFRPRLAHDAQFVYLYTTWGVPLPPILAQAACARACYVPGQRTFRFAIVKRGSYKGFERATEVEITK